MLERVRPDGIDREDALRVASAIVTERDKPDVVLAVAERLLGWLADGSPGTPATRFAAMMRHFNNIKRTGPGLLPSLGPAPAVTVHADDPDGFLAAAAAYVPFLAAEAATS